MNRHTLRKGARVNPLDIALLAAAATGSAVTAAVYVNSSAKVMPRLAGLPPHEGIATMQGFNRTALQAPFMTAFFGAALASGALAVRAVRAEQRTTADWLALGGSALYLAGFALTIAYNVPRNERLDALSPTAPGSASAWATYVREWTGANTVRAVASTAGAAALVAALVQRLR